MEPHDEQQAQVVERLRAANGAPVSFAELRAMGVENPALLCYELAAVGLPVERPREPGSGVRALSVRLQPSPAGVADGAGQFDSRWQLDSAPAGGGWDWRGHARLLLDEPVRGSRPLVAGALVLTLAAVLAIVLALGGSNGQSATRLSADTGHPPTRMPSMTSVARCSSTATPLQRSRS